MESLERRGDEVTKNKFVKIWNLLKLYERLLIKNVPFQKSAIQRVGANQSRSERSSFVHMTYQNPDANAL